jgi:hypothetical protein
LLKAAIIHNDVVSYHNLRNNESFSDQIELETNNSLKIQFIKKHYNFVLREENAQVTTQQLVSSKLYSLKESREIKKNIEDSMKFSKNGIQTSYQSPGKYRVAIQLNEFLESTLYFQNIIVSFLNETCIPTGKYNLFHIDIDNSRKSRSWEISKKGLFSFVTHSLKFEKREVIY